MRLLADANIPDARNAFSPFGEVETRPGGQIDAEALRYIEVLLVRSVTPVNEALLRESPVRFVGSATIGTDHVDREYLAEAGIAFAHAPGSNAESVVEYVLAALLATHADRGEALRGKTVGIVGGGQIGGRLARRLPALGMQVLVCDPPLAERAEAQGVHHAYHSLDTLLDSADVLTLHPPLTRTGPHPTHHLIGRAELERMKPGAWLVNASRGAVVDNVALRDALASDHLAGAVLDVWENEPTPDPDLLARCAIATPHIAGYSFDGKIQGTLMLARALADHLGRPHDPSWDALLAPDALAPLTLPEADLDETAWLDALVRQAYDLRADDARMRPLARLDAPARAEAFQALRRDYPRRRSFAWHRLAASEPADRREAVRLGLGLG